VVSFIIVDNHAAALSLCLMGSIFHFQYAGPDGNRFHCRNLYCTAGIAFAAVVVFVVVAVLVAVAGLSVQDSHVAP
jgi:hypothetical protein